MLSEGQRIERHYVVGVWKTKHMLGLEQTPVRRFAVEEEPYRRYHESYEGERIVTPFPPQQTSRHRTRAPSGVGFILFHTGKVCMKCCSCNKKLQDVSRSRDRNGTAVSHRLLLYDGSPIAPASYSQPHEKPPG